MTPHRAWMLARAEEVHGAKFTPFEHRTFPTAAGWRNAGSSSQLPDERIKQLGQLVAHVGEDLTHRMGGRSPHGR